MWYDKAVEALLHSSISFQLFSIFFDKFRAVMAVSWVFFNMLLQLSVDILTYYLQFCSLSIKKMFNVHSVDIDGLPA